MQKRIFDELSTERISKRYNMSKQIHLNDLIYYFKSKDITLINLIGFKDPLHNYKNI